MYETIGELVDALSNWDQEARLKLDGEEGNIVTLEPGHNNEVIIGAVKESEYRRDDEGECEARDEPDKYEGGDEDECENGRENEEL